MKNVIHYTYYDKKKECNAVKAVTTYDGQTITAVAYTHPTDVYNENFGKLLSGMRCEKKVLKKKLASAKRRLENETQYLIYLLEQADKVRGELEKTDYVVRETEAHLKSITAAVDDLAQNCQ